MLYEMLTGKLPFDGDSAVTIALMQLQSTPKHPREINPGIPIGLEQITMKAMEKLPSDRYTSAAECFLISKDSDLIRQSFLITATSLLLIISPQSLFTLCVTAG